MTATITLQLADQDSIRVLRAALAGAVRVQQGSADYHVETGKLHKGDPTEANRHKRQAQVYLHRRDLAQQLLDQLPTEPPKGE